MANIDTNFKVRLISVASYGQGVGGSLEQVQFNVTPRFTEARDVEYSPITPVHMPGSIQVYKNTKSRTFSIGAHFISRTPTEASMNMIYLQTLRGWTMPYFGATSTLSTSDKNTRFKARNAQAVADANQGPQQPDPEQELTEVEQVALRQRRMNTGVELLGAPPDVLYLYAYSNKANSGSAGYGGDRPNTGGVNINKIPVVITSLSITYPDDVDYIPTYSNGALQESEPFPIKMDVDITLTETHSPREYEQFDLLKFKRGVLVNF